MPMGIIASIHMHRSIHLDRYANDAFVRLSVPSDESLHLHVDISHHRLTPRPLHAFRS